MATRRRSSARRRFFSISLVLALALLIVIVRLVEETGPERYPEDRFIISRVLDGDTVELQGGDKLRLLAIDTPEKGAPFYNEATALLRRLTLGRVATIIYAGRRRDRYGRLLGYLYIDSLFINRAIIDSGLGYVYLFKDNELQLPQVGLLLGSQRGAIDRRAGLWSIEHEPEAYYLALASSFRLHRPNCRSVANRNQNNYRRFPTRVEGLALGLSPCRNCKP